MPTASQTGRRYLAKAQLATVEIDPIELKVSKPTYETVLLNGVFGALRILINLEPDPNASALRLPPQLLEDDG